MMIRSIKNPFCLLIITFLFIFLHANTNAGFWDKIKSAINKGASEQKDNKQPNMLDAPLTQEDIELGLKQALQVGVKNAANLASQKGGFFNNPKIRIPLPPEIERIGSLLKKVGYGDKVDAFEASINNAAEIAAKESLPIFTETIKGLTFEDVKEIWKGGDTAATEYLEKKTRDSLYKAFKPIVHEAMQKVDVTKKYQDMVSVPAVQNISGMLNKNLELDDYVTNKALKGLFILLAQEEKKIRENPAARTTELLKKVFKGLGN